MSNIAPVGYIPYSSSAPGAEAAWLSDALGCRVDLFDGRETLNVADHQDLPDADHVCAAVRPLLAHDWIVAEGPAAFLWTAVLRACGFEGGITMLPQLNPTSWFDVSALSVYRRFATRYDRVFVGSVASAGIYRGLGIDAQVGEPYGIDCDVFRPRTDFRVALEPLGVTGGPIALFSGRLEPDKDLYRLLGAALKAKILFPDLKILIASHVVDPSYVSIVERVLEEERGVHLILNPSRDRLARLYTAADVFVTASTSHFETFGRAPAEALACGTTAIAPRYDGFAEVLAQPGGRLVDVEIEDGVPRVTEARLLRAIYEELTATEGPSTETISTIARGRFCRSHNIGLLAHLIRPPSAVAPPRCDGESIDVPLPPPWSAALAAMQEMRPEEALAHLWQTREHVVLSKLNSEFRAAVRVALTTSPPPKPLIAALDVMPVRSSIG